MMIEMDRFTINKFNGFARPNPKGHLPTLFQYVLMTSVWDHKEAMGICSCTDPVEDLRSSRGIIGVSKLQLKESYVNS
jgi:hypothetical protein